MFYLIKTPFWLRWLYPSMTWRLPNEERKIYLTFDDGVSTELTPFILEQLAAFQAKATFFLVGDRAKRYPELVQTLVEQGHHIGNHTQHHVNGWKVPTQRYLDDVAACQSHTQTTLFRPPYGRLTRSQLLELRDDFKIIGWDVLAGDFDPRASNEECLQRLQRHTQAGSIIVLHDNIKFADKIRYVLPRILEFYAQHNFKLDVIPY